MRSERRMEFGSPFDCNGAVLGLVHYSGLRSFIDGDWGGVDTLNYLPYLMPACFVSKPG